MEVKQGHLQELEEEEVRELDRQIMTEMTERDNTIRRQEEYEQEIAACHTQMGQTQQELELECESLKGEVGTLIQEVEELREQQTMDAEIRTSRETEVLQL